VVAAVVEQRDAAAGTAASVLAVSGLKKWFPIRNAWKRRIGWLKALDDVSFEVGRGEILGIVGESGCGKTTLGKALMGIHLPTAGSIVFEGHEIAGLRPNQSRDFRQHLQFCYQDPGASLDPRWKIEGSLHEPLVIHTSLSKAERQERVRSILRAVGLPETHLDLYPHEISGGQQRRVGLARILTLQPKVIILDEPTSGLDVSVQATVLKLFLDLQRHFNLTYLFISHDLSVVRMICDRVAVMYLGKIVEIGETEAIFTTPRHPYTRSLLAAIPKIGGERVTATFWLEGEPPDPGNLPSGCRFRTRCPMARDRCAEREPSLRDDWPDQSAACFFAE
jgi:oligopeptide transport system ATP-binding protein